MLLSSTVWKIIDSVSVAFSEAYQVARARAASHAWPIIRVMARADHIDWEAKMLERELAVFHDQRSSFAPRQRSQYSPMRAARLIVVSRANSSTGRPEGAGPPC